jgi:hypothetical protein
VLARVVEYRARFGDYWKPAPLLERLAAAGRGFYSEGAVNGVLTVSAVAAGHPPHRCRWSSSARRGRATSCRSRLRAGCRRPGGLAGTGRPRRLMTARTLRPPGAARALHPARAAPGGRATPCGRTRLVCDHSAAGDAVVALLVLKGAGRQNATDGPADPLLPYAPMWARFGIVKKPDRRRRDRDARTKNTTWPGYTAAYASSGVTRRPRRAALGRRGPGPRNATGQGTAQPRRGPG